MRTIFELKVWLKQEQSCLFLLIWDNRRKQLTASTPYSRDVQKWYQRWRQRYYRFYQLPSLQAPRNSGQLNPGTGDPAHDLMEAEGELIQAFQRWLGEGDVRNIQHQIQDELARMSQSISESNQEVGDQPGIDIFLACDSEEMARLPWEAWPLVSKWVSPGVVRIVRTAMNGPQEKSAFKSAARCGKARILTILGDDPRLPLQEDWKAMRSLKSIADVKRFTWQPEDDAAAIKTKIAQTICDAHGWDVLFFAGHSDETSATGGRIAIAPNISLSISEIEEYITQAREHGLQLAIFNSCSGLSIANSLLDLGIQVAVMREPIRNDVAQSFLKPLCQQLAKHKNIHDALLSASQHLQSAEKFAYPSAHLLPSFFSPSGIVPYRIEPAAWKRQLKKYWPTRKWLPTALEATALGAVLTVSALASVQVTLLNWRTFVQASYRHVTKQIPLNELPNVLLVAIDQESIEKEQLHRSEIGLEPMQIWPMDRAYLAKLIARLSDLGARVIGIDYNLSNEQPREDELTQAIQAAIEKLGAWYVFGDSEWDNRELRHEVANRKWSLQGKVTLYPWDVPLPEDATCRLPCPFIYLLSVAKILSQRPDAPQPTVKSQADFQLEVSGYLRRQERDNQDQAIISLIAQSDSPLGMRSIIDFSIPPEQAYKTISAQELLSHTLPNSYFQHNIQRQVVIIASGGYAEAADNLAAPPAIMYWCHSQQRIEPQLGNCPRIFTGGEINAYIAHQLLSSHRIVQIPDWWMICLAALLGKGGVLVLLKQPATQRRKQVLTLIGANFVYGLFVLQVYISAGTLVPWSFPSVIFWSYVLRALNRKSLSFS